MPNHTYLNLKKFLSLVDIYRIYVELLPNIMKKTELEDKISDATLNLIDMATDICWNKISRNCEYIMSEINNSTEQNYFLSTNIRKKVNDKKSPKSLNRIVFSINCYL